MFSMLVNDKFVGKSMELGRSDGYRIVGRRGLEIEPSQLSSGEQHQLVLLYRLIFASHYPALFLIDEPELSLHVAWQEAFTADLEKIASIGDSQFLLATHSPVITGDRWDLLVGMGGELP